MSYVLTISTQKEKLYLGYDKAGKLDCTPVRDDAVKFPGEDDAKTLMSILAHKGYWRTEYVKDTMSSDSVKANSL